MKLIRTIMLLITLSCLGADMALAGKSSRRQLVLVTANTSKVTTLQQAEIRRLFLGVVIIKDGGRIHPVRNISDNLLYQVFLQKVVFMSSRQYKRHLMTRMFRHGGGQPVEYNSTNELVSYLKNKPNSVSFMWMTTAKKTKGLKIVQSLWIGRID